MRPIRCLVAALVGCVVVVPAPALADSVVRSDPRADVRYVGQDDEGGYGGSSTPIPARRQGDITTIRVTHNPRLVRVTLGFRELRKAGSHTHWFVLAGPRWTLDIFVQADRESWTGNHLVYERSEEPDVRCRFSHRIDYRRNTVQVTVPRTCLLNPAWVRAGAETGIEGGMHRFYDKAPQRGGPYAASPPVGPRVYR